MADLGSLIATLDVNMSKFESSLGRAESMLNNYAKKSVSNLKQTEKAAVSSASGMEKAFGSIKKVVAGYVGFRALGSFIQTVGTLEEGWIGIAKTTGLAGREFDMLRSGIKKMSTEMKGIRIEDFQSIAQTAGQLGIQGVSNIESFTKTVAKMSVATDLSADVAAESFAQIANIMKITIPELETVGAVMNELSNTTTATASDISDLTKRMGGAAQLLGLSTAEVIGLSASIKDMGVNIEVGGTAMSQVFTKMLSDTDKFAKVAGVDLNTFARLVQTKPVEALRVLLESMSKMSKFEAAKSLEALGLSGVRVGGVLLKLSGGLDVLDKNLKTANDEWERGTSLQNEYAVASKGLFAQATSVSNAVKILADDMGKTLLPAMKEVLNWTKKTVDAFAGFGKGLGDAAAKISLALEGYNISNLEKAGMTGRRKYNPASVRRGAFPGISQKGMAEAAAAISAPAPAFTEITKPVAVTKPTVIQKPPAVTSGMPSMGIDEKTEKQNKAIIEAQQKRFDEIRKMAEQSVLDQEQLENLRYDRQVAALNQDKKLLIEKGLITDELNSQFRESELLAETAHQEKLNQIRKDGMTASERFLEMSNQRKVASIVSSGAAILSSVAQTNKTIFALHKGLALADAAISLPSAIIKSYENAGGYPWGIIPAALMAIKGAAQIAAISKSNYTGQAHSGLDNVPNTGTYLLEKGEMVLDKGTSREVRNAAIQRQGGGEMGGNTFQFNFDFQINSPLSTQNWKRVIEEDLAPGIVDAVKKGIYFGLKKEEKFA